MVETQVLFPNYLLWSLRLSPLPRGGGQFMQLLDSLVYLSETQG